VSTPVKEENEIETISDKQVENETAATSDQPADNDLETASEPQIKNEIAMISEPETDSMADYLLNPVQYFEENLPQWEQQPILGHLLYDFLRLFVSYVVLPASILMILICLFHLVTLFL
jgi:hypothetical protein